MASISSDQRGNRTVQFVGGDGRRRSVQLGKIAFRAAEGIKTRVEYLNAAAIAGYPLDGETARWLTECQATLVNKLAAVGLCAMRESARLDDFLTRYIAGRLDVKPTTLVVWNQVRRSLVEFFGAEKPLRSITPADAERYKTALVAQGLASTTVQKRLQFARDFFNVALRHKLVVENPFTGVKIVAILPAERSRFVTREEMQRVLTACPDAEWRLIVSLVRFGGLRCPSEVLSLRWQDVDWECERLMVPSPKTERHGKAVRVIPLFPELREHLETVFDQAEQGTEYVIAKNRKPMEKRLDGRSCNFRTRFARIIVRAGLVPWPRVFHNLRASRETELAESYPMHVVCDWIGNTPDVAKKHYLQTTADHFDRAVSTPIRALQNAVQQVPEWPRKASQRQNARLPDCDTLQEVATYCGSGGSKMAEVHGNRTHRRRG